MVLGLGVGRYVLHVEGKWIIDVLEEDCGRQLKCPSFSRIHNFCVPLPHWLLTSAFNEWNASRGLKNSGLLPDICKKMKYISIVI